MLISNNFRDRDCSFSVGAHDSVRVGRRDPEPRYLFPEADLAEGRVDRAQREGTVPVSVVIT